MKHQLVPVAQVRVGDRLYGCTVTAIRPGHPRWEPGRLWFDYNGGSLGLSTSEPTALGPIDWALVTVERP